MTDFLSGSTLISTILRHDTKVTSYKIALIRALNDVVLAYPLSLHNVEGVAVPLHILAEYWFAYYFPFMDTVRPILQGPRATRDGTLREDLSFRGALTRFRTLWEQEQQASSVPSDGFYMVSEFRRVHRRQSYSRDLDTLYQQSIRQIAEAIQMPIRYAGPKGQEWAVFDRPQPYSLLQSRAVGLPGTLPQEKCLFLPVALWQSIASLSLWIEALCIHEWCLFTERVTQGGEHPVTRGTVYELLTARPDNRRPTKWEHNQIDILLMEGSVFRCPWTQARIKPGDDYDIDHVVPIAVYPVNDLWNLVPTDARFNRHTKRDRVPSEARMQAATSIFVETYRHYGTSSALRPILQEDAALRFRDLSLPQQPFEAALTHAMSAFVRSLAEARNVATF